MPDDSATSSSSRAVAPTSPLARRQLLLFTGKGGVGKSTTVAALGVRAAELGMRPLIVELGHRASMAAIFSFALSEGEGEGATIDHEPRAIACDGRLSAMRLDHDEALYDYIVAQVKIRRLARAIASNTSLRGLFGAAPAVREIVTLAKLEALAAAVDENGAPRYRPILVDLDATGHALMLLELPQLLRRLVESGPLLKVTESLAGLIGDPGRTLLSLVTLPREVPVQETIELFSELRERHAIAIDALFINQVPAPPLAGAQLPWLARAEGLVAAAAGRRGDPLAADLRLARRLVDEHAGAQAQLARLRAELPGVPQIELPRLGGGRVDEAALRELGALAEAGLDGGEVDG